MLNEYASKKIEITEEMVDRGLEFFIHFSIDLRATETTYPDFVVDLLNYTLYGDAPWPVSNERALTPAEIE